MMAARQIAKAQRVGDAVEAERITADLHTSITARDAALRLPGLHGEGV